MDRREFLKDAALMAGGLIISGPLAACVNAANKPRTATAGLLSGGGKNKNIMKKVLIITSSFRRNGNTDILADQFAKGARENGNEVEIIHLRDYKLNFCMGCWDCVKLGRCVQKDDDFNSLFPKMLEADAICFAAPTYFYNVDGRMKTFFDRCVTIYGTMHDKDFYYLTASQSYSKTDIESVFTAFHGFARCFSDIHEKGRVYGVGSDEKGDVKSTPAFNEAYELGKTVA